MDTKTSAALPELLELMELERLEINLFRGQSRDIGTPRVFGGQVLAQALLSATQTVEDRNVHSLHAYFLRAGDPEAPIVYDVDRSRDGRSFTVRRVVAIQHGRPIFNMAASFQVEEDGLEHQADMPSAPEPESIGSPAPLSAEQIAQIPQKLRRWFNRKGPFEFRYAQQLDPLDPGKQPPSKQVWFRCRGVLPKNRALNCALLAYASDFHLIATSTLPHGVSFLQGNLQMASLDHAMWFHRPANISDWLLYACDSPSASGGRGLSRGQIFDQKGRLIASTAQEGLIRLWNKSDTSKV